MSNSNRNPILSTARIEARAPDHAAGLQEAAADYASQLRMAGLSLSSPPLLPLLPCSEKNVEEKT